VKGVFCFRLQRTRDQLEKGFEMRGRMTQPRLDELEPRLSRALAGADSLCPADVQCIVLDLPDTSKTY
jgi:hypothetical protein